MLCHRLLPFQTELKRLQKFLNCIPDTSSENDSLEVALEKFGKQHFFQKVLQRSVLFEMFSGSTEEIDGYILKRIRVENGEETLLSGYREAYFGRLFETASSKTDHLVKPKDFVPKRFAFRFVLWSLLKWITTKNSGSFSKTLEFRYTISCTLTEEKVDLESSNPVHGGMD